MNMTDTKFLLNWCLNYEVWDGRKSKPVDSLSKSIILYQRIGNVHDSMEEIMRCYDNSHKMYEEEDTGCMESLILRLSHQEYMKIPQATSQKKEEEEDECRKSRSLKRQKT